MTQLARIYLYILLITGSVTLLSAENCSTGCSISCNTGDMAAQSQPHASITKWIPGSYGNYPGVGHQKRPLPIWVTIEFDQDPTIQYGNNYIQFIKRFPPLKGIQVSNHIKIRKFIVTVAPSVTKDEIESILDQANRYFDPEIKRREELAIQQAREAVEREAAARLAVEIEKKHRAEAEHAKQEAAKKAAELSAQQAMEEFKRAQLNPALLEMLHNAIMNNSEEDIQKAKNAGAAINCGKDGRSSLLWAVLFKKERALDALLKCGARSDVIYFDKTLVQHAIDLNDFESACLLAKHKVDYTGYEDKIHQYRRGRLTQAIINDSPEEIRHAVWLGAPITGNNSEMFHAVFSKKNRAIEELIKLGDNVADNKILIPMAFQTGDLKTVMLLLNNGADFYGDIPNQSPPISVVAKAIMNYYSNESWTVEFLQKVINRGYNLHEVDYSKNLWYLTFRHSQGNSRIIECLIANRANVNQVIDTNSYTAGSSWTPLFLAIYCNNINAVNLLLSAGVNVNLQANPTTHAFYNKVDAIGYCTPLFYALKMRHAEIAELLSKHGANL